MSEHSLIGCGKCSKFKHHCSFTLVVCTSVDQAKVSHLLSFNRFIMNPHYLKALSWLEVFAVSWVCELNAYQISKCFGHFFNQIWSCLLLGNLPSSEWREAFRYPSPATLTVLRTVWLIAISYFKHAPRRNYSVYMCIFDDFCICMACHWKLWTLTSVIWVQSLESIYCKMNQHLWWLF